jgi:hypothetical protein
MKNLKIKLGTFLGMLFVLGSCSSEKVGESNEVANPLVGVEVNEEIGKTENGYNYADNYSDKFNYYHNDIKLTDEALINTMLKNAVNVHHDEDKIEISMTENEKKELFRKADISLDDNEADASAKVSKSNKVYHHIINGKSRFHGAGSRNYGKFRPKQALFGNIGNAKRTIVVFFNKTTTSYAIGKNKVVKTKAGGRAHQIK